MDENEDFEEGVERKVKKIRPERRRFVADCDCPPELRDEIIEFGEQALDEHSISKNIAQFMKQNLDKNKGGTWHTIVGSHFGGNVTNDAQTLVNFRLDCMWFLAFRSGPPEKKKE